MQEKISLQELIALNNTQQAKNLIKKYGYRPARNYDDLIQKLYRFTKENREEALKELANLHPHKDLILNYFCVAENKSNADGLNNPAECVCPSCQMARMKMMGYSNLTGDENTDKNDKMLAYLPPVLLGVVVGVILVGTLRII
jgi:hypothetical protein